MDYKKKSDKIETGFVKKRSLSQSKTEKSSKEKIYNSKSQEREKDVSSSLNDSDLTSHSWESDCYMCEDSG